MNSESTSMFTSTMVVLIVVLLICLTAVTVTFILYNQLGLKRAEATIDEVTFGTESGFSCSTGLAGNRKKSKRRESNISGNTNITILDETMSHTMTKPLSNAICNRDLECSMFYWVPADQTPTNCHFNAFYDRGLQSNVNTLTKSNHNIYLV